MMWPRRERLEIMAEILEITSHGGATKTSIVYKANLNFTIVQRYLRHLESKGIIEQSNGSGNSVYKLTSKGRTVLHSVRTTLDLVLDVKTAAS